MKIRPESRRVLPPCGQRGSCSYISPVGVEEDVDERGGDGRQRGWIQRHDAELVLRDEHWVNCRLDGCKRPDCFTNENFQIQSQLSYGRLLQTGPTNIVKPVDYKHCTY